IDTMPALHTTKGLEVVFARATRVVVPLGHEQARATGAGSRVELLTHGKQSNCKSSLDVCHNSALNCLRRLYSSCHDSASRCWFDTMCCWLEIVPLSTAVGDTVARSHDPTMN